MCVVVCCCVVPCVRFVVCLFADVVRWLLILGCCVVFGARYVAVNC